MVTEPQEVCGAAMGGGTCSSKASQQRRPTSTAPGPRTRKNSQKPLLGIVCLLTIGVLISVGRRPPAAAAEPSASQFPNRRDCICASPISTGASAALLRAIL